MSITGYYHDAAGATINRRIRRNSDGFLWTGAAFEAEAGANLASYTTVMPATRVGGQWYAAAFPDLGTSTSVTEEITQQAGASPAWDDRILQRRLRYWDDAAGEARTPVDGMAGLQMSQALPGSVVDGSVGEALAGILTIVARTATAVNVTLASPVTNGDDLELTAGDSYLTLDGLQIQATYTACPFITQLAGATATLTIEDRDGTIADISSAGTVTASGSDAVYAFQLTGTQTGTLVESTGERFEYSVRTTLIAGGTTRYVTPLRGRVIVRKKLPDT